MTMAMREGGTRRPTRGILWARFMMAMVTATKSRKDQVRPSESVSHSW
jgi:hypothetical protein